MLEKTGITAHEQQHRRPQHRVPQILGAFGVGQRLAASQVAPDIEDFVGDFDGDGGSDILWRHRETGWVSIWLDGEYATRRATESVKLVWDLAGVGDFDADGESDILWRHTTTGQNYLWMSGYKTQGQWLESEDLHWQVEGVGDFNADDEADIFWRHDTSGQNRLWMSGDKFAVKSLATVSRGITAKNCKSFATAWARSILTGSIRLLYRGARQSAASRVEALGTLGVVPVAGSAIPAGLVLCCLAVVVVISGSPSRWSY